MNAASNQTNQGAHVALEPAALANGRVCLSSAMEHGFVGPLDIPTEAFHPDLLPVARFAREARENGAKEYADVLLYLIESTKPGQAQDLLRSQIADVADEVHHIPESLEGSAAIVHQYHLAKRRQNLLWRMNKANEQGEPIGDILKQLAEIEAGGGSRQGNLRERAYAMRFDPNETPPPDEACMMIGDIPIAARGNLTVIQGKSKVGKSAVVSAILAAAQRGNYHNTGDALCISWTGDSTGAIIHLDTEQSRADWHGLVSRSITRSGMQTVSDRLISLPLVMFARSERLAILRESLRFEMELKGGVDAVVIDGIADLCKSPNDETEALELVSLIHAMSQEFKTPIYCILHENPGTEQAKTRGHLGSELNRKAFANIRIDKDGEGVSTIYGTDMRKRDIPKEQGFCFAWDDTSGMHTFQGRAAGLKASQKEAEAIAKAREEWTPIFEFSAGQRENMAVPALSPKEAVEIEREISGNEKLTKPDTMKKRMQKAESLGVLRKFDLLRWALNDSGNGGKGAGK